MEKTKSFEVPEPLWTEPNKNRILNERTVLKCATWKANASNFEGQRIDKDVLSGTKDKTMQFLARELYAQVLSGNCVDILDVVGKGTKLMKSIKFPTVIVKLRTLNLKKSTMYYVVLEIETEGSRHKVPALMFSNPHDPRKTKLAELLPLSHVKCPRSIIRLTPMMDRKRYRYIIRRGFSFKVISLIPGRAFGSDREHS